MRVAIISYHTSPLAQLGSSSAGGMNVYVRRLAEGLAERSVKVDVFTRRERPEDERELEFVPGARLVTVRAGPVRALPKAQLARYTPIFARSVAGFGGRNNHYDIIHSHYWLSGLAAQTMRTQDQPLVHMFHTLRGVKQLYQPEAALTDAPSRDYGERTLLRSRHTMVFATTAEVDDVERAYGVRPACYAVIPPGVDQERFVPSDATAARTALGLPSGPMILFVGRMDRAKGVESLLQAAGRLRRSGEWPTLSVVIIGGDDQARDWVARRELDRLVAISAGLGLDGAVQFRGVVPQEELARYYAACDVCAVPSVYESFGMVALEALASGRPVVGFRSRGLEQTVRHERTGLLVQPGDVEALAGALARLLSDPCMARRMGIAARESVKQYTWERMVDETIILYSQLLTSKPDATALRSS